MNVSSTPTEEAPMFTKFIAIFAALFLASAAHAQANSYIHVNKDGETIFIESNINHQSFWTIVGIVEKAGYARYTTQDTLPETKADTWCAVNIHHGDDILAYCYTPYIGHGVTIKDYADDYQGILPTIEKIRDEHRRAIKALDIRPPEKTD